MDLIEAKIAEIKNLNLIYIFTTDNILNSDFEINPKVYDKQNISCGFCPFNDICYTKEKDLTYLEKVEDLSFLGGDE